MDKDSKGQRKMEDSGGGLLPAVEGHSLEWIRIGTLTTDSRTTCGVVVSTSAFPTSTCHQCLNARSSLGWGLNFDF